MARITSVSLTPDDVNAFANEFITDVEAGVHQERGWPNVNLGMSQLCKIAFHKALANKLRDENVVFAMACPGHCRTDMSSQNGSKSAEEGSRTPAWLALMDATESATINGKVQNTPLDRCRCNVLRYWLTVLFPLFIVFL